MPAFQPTPSSYGEGDSRGSGAPSARCCFNPRPPHMGRATIAGPPRGRHGPQFQPTPSSYGEGDLLTGSAGRALHHVSTHALLIWGGRRVPVTLIRQLPGVSTHALLIWGGRPPGWPVDTGARVFQPPPSSYGEGDCSRRSVSHASGVFQPTPSSYGE